MLQHALQYGESGFAIFPVVPGGKTPLVSNGFHAATTDRRQLMLWWADMAWPNANIGLPTGEQNGFFVIDIDAKSGGLESLKSLQLPDTAARVNTGGGGVHVYFKYPKGMHVKTRAGLLPGIDVRGRGGYVVAPPSVHESGGTYEWATTELTEAPAHILDLVVEKEVTRHDLIAKGTSGREAEVIEGGRNNYLTQQAGRMRRAGLGHEAMSAALHAENKAKCDPPLPDREVDTIVWSVGRYDASNPVQAGRINYTKAADLLPKFGEYLQNKDKLFGEPTGLEGLDVLLGGGKRLGQLTVTHAEAKTGKNTLWHYMMWLWLTKGIPIAYASREISPECEVLPQLLSCELSSDVAKVEPTEDVMRSYGKILERWPLYFSTGYGSFPLEDLEQWVHDLADRGVKYFWIDHLHYMLAEPEDHKEASKLIKLIKTLVNTREIHIDLIVQPNKLLDGQSLGLNTVKGGAAIGQTLDNLITLERVKGDGGRKTNVCKLTMAAGRHRHTRHGAIYVEYNPDTSRFREVEMVDDDSDQPESLRGRVD